MSWNVIPSLLSDGKNQHEVFHELAFWLHIKARERNHFTKLGKKLIAKLLEKYSPKGEFGYVIS